MKIQCSCAPATYENFIPFQTLKRKRQAVSRITLALFAGLLFAVFPGNKSEAQTVSVSYPSGAAAQSLTRGYSSSLLTVRLSYSAACTGSTITIALPVGILYVAGSINKTTGTGGTATTLISEANISNLRRPVFTTGSISAAGDLTFTIARLANCGTSSSGKDSVYVTGNCGTASETNGTANTYTIFAPALTQTGPNNLTSAYINTLYTRTFRITNGGNGCLDTLRLAIKRTTSSMGGAVLKIGTTAITPYATSVDTSFFKIYDANLPGGDNLMCNGEFIDFTEQFTLLTCTNLTTTFLVSWGRPGTICSVTSTTGLITMGTGVVSLTGAINRIQQLNWCRQGVFSIALTNGGSGNKAGAAYNLLPNIGYNGSGNTTAPGGINPSTRGRIDSFKVNGVTVPITAATGSVSAQARFSGLTSDPDGAGTGIDDLDGDGQYDDLLPGKSVLITVYEHWENLATANCPSPTYGFFNSYTAGYSAMCGTSYTTNPLTATGLGSYRIGANSGGIITTPAEVLSGTPFAIQACVNLSSYNTPNPPVDSLFFDIVFPAGLSLAPVPGISYNGVAITPPDYYVDTSILGGIALHVRRKTRAAAFCFSANLVYNCTGNNIFSPQFNITYKGDTCSQSVEYHMCKTTSIKVSCVGVCTNGIKNYLPSTKRLTLGYTSAAMTTKVAASAVTGLAVYTALAMDTIQIIVPGSQLATSGSFNNLYYNLQFGRVSGTDIFRFASGTFNQVSGATTTSAAISDPVTTSSTTLLQKMKWDLSTNLNNGIISNNDSVWLDLRFVITRGNADSLYGNVLTQVPNTSSTLYNLTPGGIAAGCDTAHAINLLLTGNSKIGNFTAATNISNCSGVNITSSEYFGNSTGPDIFPAEYRPQVIIDSVLVTLPAGYTLSGSFTQYVSRNWNSLVVYGSNPTSSLGIISQTGASAWMIKNPYAASGGWLPSDLGNVGMSNYGVTYQVSPTCAAVTGTQGYNVQWFYRDFVYTGNAANYVNKVSILHPSSLTYNATVVPSLTLQNSTGIVPGVLPQHFWDVQFNSNGTATPTYIWMALDRLSSGITIDSVIYDGSNISAGAISYAGNKTWFRLSAAGIVSGTSKAARIYFKYANCTADSIKMLTGWNCGAYPSPDPSANVCSEISQYLKVVPQNSQIQLNILRQPGNGSSINLCSPDSVSIIVNSALNANVDNPVITVTPPAGLNMVTPIRVEYPLGSGNWQSLPATSNAGVYTINLEDHTGIGTTGLKGVAAAGGVSANRQANVVVQYNVNCSFVANSLIGFTTYGTSPCGAMAIGNGNRVNSNGVAITGATVAGGVSMTISPAANNFSCGDAASTLSFTITPLNGVTTISGDVAEYNLPAGLGYVANSFVRGSNCSGCTVISAAGSSGTTDLQVTLDAGVASGTPILFSVQVQPAGGGCGNATISGAMRRNTATISCNGITCGATQAIIATASQGVTLLKPQLDITGLISTNACMPSAGVCTYDLYFTNNGSLAAPANTYIAEFFCAGTTPIYTHTIAASVAMGSSVIEPVSFSIPYNCGGKPLSVKISPAPVSSAARCLCSESVYEMAVILPVKLLTFNGVLKDETVTLTWKTADEVSMKGFFVERSIDGIRFTTITYVPASRNASGGTYTGIDNSLPAGSKWLYYRLRIEDVNGAVTYSPVITLTNNNHQPENITIKPNPVKSSLQLNLPVYMPLVKVRLMTATGQMVLNTTAVGGSNLLNTIQLANGVYLLQVVKDGKVIFSQKVIKE